MRTFSTLTIILWLASFCSALIAKSATPFSEEVVVTGTRTEQAYWESPVKVTLVSRAEIEKNHAKNAFEAIKNVSGVDFKAPIGKEGKSVWIQGVSANRVIVLIDGEPVSSGTGSTVDLTQIPTTKIERIEIVKGATSALYGSSAIGGVVNIITANPEGGFHARLQVDAGTFGGRDVEDGRYSTPKQSYDAALSYGGENFAVETGFNAILSNGFMAGTDDWSQPGPSGEQFSGFTEGTWFSDTDSEHSLRYEFYKQVFETRYMDEKGGKDLRLYKVDNVFRNTVRYHGESSMADSRWQWGAVYEQFENDSKPTPSDTRRTEMSSGNINIQNDTGWGMHQITQGVQATYNDLSVIKNGLIEVPESIATQYEYYVQDQVVFDQLQILPGLRAQYNKDFGYKVTPKINGRFDFINNDDRTLYMRAGVGSGYRVPNLKERYFILDHSDVGENGYFVYGNTDLKPESSISYQLELGLLTAEDFQFSANVFLNELTDLIDTALAGKNSENNDIYRYKNIAKARTQGMEFNVHFLPWDVAGFNIGYSYLDAKDLVKQRRLNNRSRHQIKGQAELAAFDDVTFLLNARFQSDQVSYDDDDVKYTTPAFTVFDIKANYQLTPLFSLYGGVDNLTDLTKNYRDSEDQRPRDGRYIYLGFTLDY